MTGYGIHQLDLTMHMRIDLLMIKAGLLNQEATFIRLNVDYSYGHGLLHTSTYRVYSRTGLQNLITHLHNKLRYTVHTVQSV